MKSDSDVTIVDCGPRDGISALAGCVPTGEKTRLINGLIAAGVQKIDCVAFTHPRIMPESADAERVIESVEKEPNVGLIGVAPVKWPADVPC